MVLEVKYKNNSDLAKVMGKALANKVQVCRDCFLTPVPLHKESKRVYNQAKLISKGISDIWGNPVFDFLTWRSDAGSQVGKTRIDRTKLSPEAVRSTIPDLKGKKILLVDDVATTGMTLEVCSKTIKRSGGEVIGAVTWSVSPY